MSVVVAEALGSPAPAMDSLFPADLCGLPATPAPVPSLVRVHPLTSLAPSSESLSPLAGPWTLRPRSSSPGVSFPIATSTEAVHLWRVSRAHLRSALDVSHVLDGLLLLRPCGLISSHSHVRDSLFRGFPHHPAAPAHRRNVPSCRLAPVPATGFPQQRQPPAPRLQGFDPSGDPLPLTGCLDPPEPDPLLSSCSLGTSSAP